jgi:hypothetical protein
MKCLLTGVGIPHYCPSQMKKSSSTTKLYDYSPTIRELENRKSIEGYSDVNSRLKNSNDAVDIDLL